MKSDRSSESNIASHVQNIPPIYLNQNLIIFGILWVLSGFVIGNLTYLIVLLCAIYMAQKKMYLELFIGFVFILILSDSRQGIFNFAGTAKEIYILLLTFVVLVDKSFRPLQKFYIYFIPFFGIAVVALTLSPTIVLSSLKTLSYFLIIFLVPNFFSLLYNKYQNVFLEYLTHFGLIILLIGLFLNFISPDFVNLGARYSGLFGNPNGLGVFLILYTLLFEALYREFPNVISRKARYFILVVIGISLILSGSRTALLSIGLFYILLFTVRVTRVLTILFVILLIVFSQFIISYLPTLLVDLNLQEFARLETLEDMSGRTVAYTFAWQEILNNFWIGKGFAYSEYIFGYYQDMLNALGHQGGTHNTYLTIWLDTGFIGLTFFVLGWISLFWKASKTSIIALPIGLSLIISTFFESWLVASLNPFTIHVLIILSLIIIPKDSE